MKRLRRGLAWVLMAAADGYRAVVPVRKGQAWLRSWVTGRLLRLEVFVPRRLAVPAEGQSLPLWVNAGAWTGARLWAFGENQVEGAAECAAVMRGRPGGVFLDLGANVGVIGFLVAASCPGTRVIAVEPHGGLAALLRRSAAELGGQLARHGSRVEVIEAALGDVEGVANFHALAHDDISSIFPVAGHGGEVRTVAMRRGDELLAELGVGDIELCKLDVEGAERLVLAGLEQTLRAGRIRRLRMELNRERCAAAGGSPEELVARLAARGYALVPESADRFARGGWDWADFNFTPVGLPW